MTKFHINKKGVPSPCRAKKGNCPLGGDESHFSSQKDAQEYVNKQNASTHGLLPGVEEAQVQLDSFSSYYGDKWKFGRPMDIQIPQEVVDNVFMDVYDPKDDYIATGVLDYHKDETSGYEDCKNSENAYERAMAYMPEFFNHLPEDMRNSSEMDYKENVGWHIVPKKNLKEHFRRYYLEPREDCDDDDRGFYGKIVETIKNNAPEELIEDDEYFEIDFDLQYDMADFASKYYLEKSEFKINGEKYFIEPLDGEFPINVAEPYFKSGAYEEFKKKKASGEEISPWTIKKYVTKY